MNANAEVCAIIGRVECGEPPADCRTLVEYLQWRDQETRRMLLEAAAQLALYFATVYAPPASESVH